MAGETGSGKTTQLPKMCLEARPDARGQIGCTQPRRVAALSVSRRVAEELGVVWGREVGCKIRFKDDTARDTRIKFMTDGILLAEIPSDPLLRRYSTIILDEAHQIPDLATQFFGISLGSRELERLVEELRAATLTLSQPALQRCLDKVHTALNVLRAEAPREEGRYELGSVCESIEPPLRELARRLQDLQDAVLQLTGSSPEIDKLHELLCAAIETALPSQPGTCVVR